MLDVISIGDATIDIFVQIHDAEVKCNLDKSNCLICLEYGDKIAVDKLSHQVAGNAANNAVGSSRLGLKTAIYVNVGDDSSGQQIVQKLKKEGVEGRYVQVHTGMESNLSVVLNFQSERTIFVYHQKWQYRLPDLEKSRWIYFTSLSESFVNTSLIQELENFLERTGTKLLYNPGTYQMKVGVKKNPKLLTLTEIFIVNKTEARRILTGKDDGELEIKKMLKGVTDLGPRMAIITDGVNGSYGYDGERFYSLKIFPSHLVEMTGAGDAYATGVLAAFCYGKDLPEAMRWGAVNGASVVEHVGPQGGLLSYDEIQKRLKDHSEVRVIEI